MIDEEMKKRLKPDGKSSVADVLENHPDMIDEYLDMADEFFQKENPGFHALMERVKKQRADEGST